jgi:hypothetical protein
MQGSMSESILQKAVRVTAEKNVSGISSFPSLVSSDFVLLSSRSDAHLIAVAADVGLAIKPSVGSRRSCCLWFAPRRLLRLC